MSAMNPMYFGIPAKRHEELTTDYHFNQIQLYGLYYNKAEAAQTCAELVIRAAVGLAQMMDVDMTVEEAIALQTDEQEPTAVYKGWEGFSYCPGEVMHIVSQDPTTEQVIYHILPKALFDSVYGDLEIFMAVEVMKYQRLVDDDVYLHYPDMGFSIPGDFDTTKR